MEGLSPIGLREDELLAVAKTGALSGLALDEVFPDLESKNYDCDELGLAFWCENGLVTTMSMLPKYINDEAVWPR